MLDSIIILSDQLYMYITFLAFSTVFCETYHTINLTETYIRFFNFFCDCESCEIFQKKLRAGSYRVDIFFKLLDITALFLLFKCNCRSPNLRNVSCRNSSKFETCAIFLNFALILISYTLCHIVSCLGIL